MAGKLADPGALMGELQTIPDEDLVQVSAGAAPAKSTDAVRDMGRLSDPEVLDAMIRLLGMR